MEEATPIFITKYTLYNKVTAFPETFRQICPMLCWTDLSWMIIPGPQGNWKCNYLFYFLLASTMEKKKKKSKGEWGRKPTLPWGIRSGVTGHCSVSQSVLAFILYYSIVFLIQKLYWTCLWIVWRMLLLPFPPTQHLFWIIFLPWLLPDDWHFWRQKNLIFSTQLSNLFRPIYIILPLPVLITNSQF